MRGELQPSGQRASGLVDVLDRVLDKGLAIAGDIKISLAEVELLTIRIRLIVCSIDKAQEIGLDWWRHDPAFSGKRAFEADRLRKQISANPRWRCLRRTAGPARLLVARSGSSDEMRPHGRKFSHAS